LPFESLAVRITIATGTVVVGNIGSGARRGEMAVVDETPNLAAQLQAQASPGEIIIAAQTFRLVADFLILTISASTGSSAFLNHKLPTAYVV
jgi:class 3 adenylate cyclase